jgi:hypothetical protein
VELWSDLSLDEGYGVALGRRRGSEKNPIWTICLLNLLSIYIFIGVCVRNLLEARNIFVQTCMCSQVC